MNNISKERFDEILREEIARTRLNTLFFETFLKLEKCNNEDEISKILNESKELNEDIFGSDGILNSIMAPFTGGAGGGGISAMRQTLRQRFINWLLETMGMRSEISRKFISEVFERHSIPQIWGIIRNPQCDTILPVATEVASDMIARELVDAIQNISVEHVPLIHHFVSTSSEGFGSIKAFVSNLTFGAAAEDLGTHIRNSQFFKDTISENIEVLCNNIVSQLQGFSVTDLNPFNAMRSQESDAVV